MKLLPVIFLALVLIGCGGGGDSLPQEQTPKFYQEELNNTILLSKSILEGDFSSLTKGVSIVLYNAGIMREFSLTKEVEGNSIRENAEYTEQPWTVLVDGKIQITYPEGITCFTKKESETSTEIEISGECTNNLEMSETVIKPLEFNSATLQGKIITTIFEGRREVFDFKDDGTFTLTTDHFANDVTPQGSGTFTESKYKNAVRVTLPGTRDYDGYSLLFLVEGDLSNGKVVEVRYLANEILDNVLIHTTTENNTWAVTNWYTNWEIRGAF